MVNRIGGLASGMDIDSIVKKLMNAERAPLNKLFQKKTTYEWQRDAYRGVNAKLKAFDTYIADNLVLKSISTKTATSSNSNLVSALATGKASGTMSIEGVSQLAEAGRITSGQVNANGSTKMKDLASGTIEFRAIQADGTMAKETAKIEITDDMTVNDFVKK
jgi:flagellar hook-associated protein 2